MIPGLGMVRSVDPPIRVCMSKGYTCTSEKMALFLQQFIDCHNEYTATRSDNSSSSGDNRDMSSNDVSNRGGGSGDVSSSDNSSSGSSGDEGEEEDRIDIHIKG